MVTQASGGSRGGARGARLPLFLDETETRRAEKILGDPPLSMSLNDGPPPPNIPRSGSGTAGRLLLQIQISMCFHLVGGDFNSYEVLLVLVSFSVLFR